jgi:hypothetical protein
MSEEENSAEEVYIPIFMDLCDLTTNIINKFINKQIQLDCTANQILGNTRTTYNYKTINYSVFLLIPKYDDSSNKLGWTSYPRIFYVKLSDLLKKYNTEKNDDVIMNDELNSHIKNLINFMNGKYYYYINSSKKTFNVTIRETSGYYGDSADSTISVTKNDMIIDNLTSPEMITLLKNINEYKNGGKPSRKRKPRTKRKRTQKKNTKKRFRK